MRATPGREEDVSVQVGFEGAPSWVVGELHSRRYGKRHHGTAAGWEAVPLRPGRPGLGALEPFARTVDRDDVANGVALGFRVLETLGAV